MTTTTTGLVYQFSHLTIKGKKNNKVKIIANERKRNKWSDIYRRKRIMSEYFSETAFGSESETKKELWHPKQDPLLQRKYRIKILVWNAGVYDETALHEQEEAENQNRIALMSTMGFAGNVD